MVKQAFFVSLLCLHTVAFPGDLSKDTSKGIVDQLSNHGWQFTEFKGLNDEDKNTVFEKHQENETKRILTPEIIESEYKKLPLEQQRDVFQKAHINLSTDMIESQYQTLDPDTKREIFQKANVNLSTDMIESQYQKLDPIKKREIFQKGNVQLLGDQIIAQYLSLPPEERESALKTILKTIEDLEKRQKLVDSLIFTPTLKTLIKQQPQTKCDTVAKHINPKYFGAIPLIEWVNLSHLMSYFQPMMTETFVNRDQFNEFNSFNQWGLWIEPYGQSTHFKQNEMQFDFSSLGISAGGEMKLYERFVLGIGASYSRSNASLPHEKIESKKVMNDVDWKSTHATSMAINTLYVGPYLGYVFHHGYISLSLLGAGNFYDIQHKRSLETKFNNVSISSLSHTSTIEHTSWDLIARLEGGVAYSPDKCFFFYPTMRVDYLNVFEQDCTDEVKTEEEEIDLLSVESLHTSFLTSKMGLKITREFFNIQYGFLIPGLSAGWLYYTPISADVYHFNIDTCNGEGKLKINSWNQYFIGANFTVIHKRGILLTLDYEITLGATAPSQSGMMRFELSW